MCSSQSCTRAEYNSLRARGPEILAELPAMTTETMFLIFTRYQLRNTYVNGTLLVSTYLCLQKLTPIKGFPKCLSIVCNLQSGPKIFMRASCGLNNLVVGRGYKIRPACNSGSSMVQIIYVVKLASNRRGRCIRSNYLVVDRSKMNSCR